MIALVIAIDPFATESGHYTMAQDMNKTLDQQQCVPCTVGTPPLTNQEEDELLMKLDDWKLDRDDVHQLYKTFIFNDFKEAMAFIAKVGELAEKEQHHPDIKLHNYKKVTVTLFTHKIKGLSHNDFIMAAKIHLLQ
jgi:4a-hydroxytetrahydrobiopterin dehydratase